MTEKGKRKNTEAACTAYFFWTPTSILLKSVFMTIYVYPNQYFKNLPVYYSLLCSKAILTLLPILLLQRFTSWFQFLWAPQAALAKYPRFTISILKKYIEHNSGGYRVWELGTRDGLLSVCLHRAERAVSSPAYFMRAGPS